MPAKSTIPAKEIHKLKIIEYLGNPENEPLSREKLSVSVLGFKHGTQIYQHFTPDEICEMEREALEIRRKKYASALILVDKALFAQAATGDTQAAKLIYQRFEGWSEKIKNEHSGGLTVVIESPTGRQPVGGADGN